MNLPFTTEQFLTVFEQYNLAIWPMQLVAYALGLGAVWLAIKPVRHSDRVIGAILAFFWLWMGAVYHLLFFRPINGAAAVFGALFIVQAVVWLRVGVTRPGLKLRIGSDARSILGALFVVYAMVIYPIVGTLLGHAYPRSPVFGVAPCPTTIFTFGLLLWTAARVPKYVLAIPLVWSVVGFSAALTLGIREDVGLLVAGLVCTAVLVWRDRRGQGSRVTWSLRGVAG
jgi:hypothetical protein